MIVVGAGMAGAAISYVLAAPARRWSVSSRACRARASTTPRSGTTGSSPCGATGRSRPTSARCPTTSRSTPTAPSCPTSTTRSGGSTNHYSGFWHRLKPVDFRKGTEHGVEDTIDWPMSYEELAPYYDQNDADVGISGVPGDLAYPPRPDAPRQPFVKHGEYHNLLATGLDKLGVHWWPADNAILTEDRGDRLACNSCGQCNFGCPRGSLGTATQAYLKPALAHGLDLRAGARVSRDHHGRHGCGRRRGVHRHRHRDGAPPQGAARRRGLQRHRHAAPAPALGVEGAPRGSRQRPRPGRPLLHDARLPPRGHVVRPPDRSLEGAVRRRVPTARSGTTPT